MKNKKASVIFIFFTVLLDFIGIGIIAPVIPNLITEFNHGNNSMGSIAFIGSLLMFTYAFMLFVFSPIIGKLSDIVGRRPIILLSLFCFFIDYLILFFADSLFVLFLGRAIAGISGSSLSTSYAYINDISTPKEKPKNFGKLGAAFGLGFVLGPVIGGVVSHFWGHKAPFLAAAFLSLLNLLYGFFILPESIHIKYAVPFKILKILPHQTVKKIFFNKQFRPYYIQFLFMTLAFHSLYSNWSFFVIEKFSWKPLDIGISLGIVGLSVALVQGTLIKPINNALGNKKSIVYGYLIACLSFILFGFTTWAWSLYIIIFINSFSSISNPAFQTELTSKMPVTHQGELQGTLVSVNSIAAVLGPLIMNNVFGFFLKTHPDKTIVYYGGAPFFVSAIFCLVALFIYLRYSTKSLSNHLT
ncbi:MAG: TCR/Tet family MFS transporter [Alphaproteobacteria bacterium]|nr:TCR/Tet family MFS transporter [Alphaproteobacteria bacterium]